MSTTIKILPQELANKIAAGEVVQRPASVVKELCENSLDAGARAVTVAVSDSGKSLIKVLDDGNGMSPDDVRLSVERHATSKITNAADLEAIRTLGFRGEALASIGAVSHLEVRSKVRSSDLGHSVRVEGGRFITEEPVSMEPGTVVNVRNLFYNTPGRRNFLKSPQTELRNITDVVTRLALAHPSIGWMYVHDDEILLECKPTDSAGRIREIFGERLADSLVRVFEQHDVITVDGYIGKPDLLRKSRSDQYIYVNGRFILNRTISHAVFHAYESLLEKGGFPFFILNLSLPAESVDVNVHPSKMEVKFSDDSFVYKSVYGAVRRALSDASIIPSAGILEGRTPTFTMIPDSPAAQIPGSSWTSPTSSDAPSGAVFTLPFDRHRTREQEVDSSVQSRFPTERLPGSSETIVEQGRSAEDTPDTERTLWQVHRRYIISQIKGGILVVDQHVAHERILYEKIMASFQNSLSTTQQLLFPQTLEFPTSDILLIESLIPFLEQMGFVIKPFGKNTVLLEGVPADVRSGEENSILQLVVEEYKTNEHKGISDMRHNLAASFACKAAVKSGDRLNQTEMGSLIDQLFATTMPYACPHGRPIVVKVTLEELDKRFGRT